MRWRDRLEIGAACAVVPCLLELVPATRALGWLARVPPRHGGAISPERLAFHVDRILHRAPWIWHHTCLRRAAVLAVLLRRDRRDADVVLGVRKRSDGSLEAHAWLRCGAEEPFLERGDITPYERLVKATSE